MNVERSLEFDELVVAALQQYVDVAAARIGQRAEAPLEQFDAVGAAQRRDGKEDEPVKYGQCVLHRAGQGTAMLIIRWNRFD